jgi:hypothetical protein
VLCHCGARKLYCRLHHRLDDPSREPERSRSQQTWLKIKSWSVLVCIGLYCHWLTPIITNWCLLASSFKLLPHSSHQEIRASSAIHLLFLQRPASPAPLPIFPCRNLCTKIAIWWMGSRGVSHPPALAWE